MISFEEALNIALSVEFNEPAVESVVLGQCIGRVLAAPVLSDTDMPPFSRSAMDGYACRRADLKDPLEVVEEIPAGHFPGKMIQKGQSAKIMTGAPVPDGCDWVVRIEDTFINEEGKVVITKAGKVSNIRYQGEDAGKGEILIPAGTMVKKQHIGIMAATGMVHSDVYCLPKVGVIATGSELVPPSDKPGISQIRNSNGPQLIAQLQDNGITGKNYGIAADEQEGMKGLFLKSVSDNDVVLISGGVSAGDYDFVPELLSGAGLEIKFHKMNVRPGKPLLFAAKQGKYVFGIPGNPVSTFVQFEVLVKPFLLKMMGCEKPVKPHMMPMGLDYTHMSSHLRIFIPVRFEDSGAIPLEYHGSGHLTSYAGADGILEIPENTEFISSGEPVLVRPL